MNDYNLTERSRQVLQLALEESVRLRHEYAGTEHLLLALIHEGEGVAAAVVQSLGADTAAIRRTIEDIIKQGREGAELLPLASIPFTSRAKKSLELAAETARDLGHPCVGTAHLLLGLLREDKGIAAQVLFHFGVTYDRAAGELSKILAARPE